jgi:hypothetical protein
MMGVDPELDKGCDGSREVPQGTPVAELLRAVSGTLGLASPDAEILVAERLMLYPPKGFQFSDGMTVRWELTEQELATLHEHLPKLVLYKSPADARGASGNNKVVVVQPLQCSAYILTGDGNSALLHGMERADASEGMALTGHRDSSTLFRDVATGRRAMPDYTLVTTHVGAIMLNGSTCCLARFATVNWGHSSRVRRVKRGDTGGDSD